MTRFAFRNRSINIDVANDRISDGQMVSRCQRRQKILQKVIENIIIRPNECDVIACDEFGSVKPTARRTQTTLVLDQDDLFEIVKLL